MKKVIMLSVLCALIGTVNAGWTVVINSDLATPLDTSGSLIKASNLGAAATVQTIGGITYDVDYSNITGANPASTGGLTFYGGGDTALANLLNNAGKVSEWQPKDMFINLSGLTVGYDYRIQLIFTGSWSGCDLNLYGNGSADYKYVYFGNSNERVGTYTWTADAATRVIRLNMAAGFGDVYLQGYAVHEIVPEPATLMLLGLGSLISLRRKARRSGV